jgi:hypothetical protein
MEIRLLIGLRPVPISIGFHDREIQRYPTYLHIGNLAYVFFQRTCGTKFMIEINRIIKENSVKKFIVLLFTFGMFGFLAACAPALEKQVIQPTEDKLTFVFFYTDG